MDSNNDTQKYIENPLMPKPNSGMQVVDLQQNGGSEHEDKSIIIKEDPLAASMVVVNGNGTHAFDDTNNANLFNIKDTYIMTKDQADLSPNKNL